MVGRQETSSVEQRKGEGVGGGDGDWQRQGEGDGEGVGDARERSSVEQRLASVTAKRANAVRALLVLNSVARFYVTLQGIEQYCKVLQEAVTAKGAKAVRAEGCRNFSSRSSPTEKRPRQR